MFKYLFESVFNSFRYMPRSGIAASYGNSMFKCSGNHYTVFRNSCTILYPHQEHARLQISLSPRHVKLLGKPPQVATLGYNDGNKIGIFFENKMTCSC